MLKSNTLAIQDVAALKLMSGEELIGKVVSLDEKEIVISNPAILVMQRQQNPQTGEVEAGMAWGPFMMALDDEANLTVSMAGVVSKFKARKEISDAYNVNNSSLELPQKSSIII